MTMIWPFKGKEKMPNEGKLDELMERVHDDVQAHGGFVVIALNGPKVNGNESISASAMIASTNKAKVIFTVANAIQMQPMDVFAALAQYRDSKIGFKSPIQAKDLGKEG